MRKLILSMQMSVDGFVEGPNGDMGYIDTGSEELWQDVFWMIEKVDLCLLGRVMYPGYRDYWIQAQTNPKATSNEIRYAKLAASIPHIVFSSTLKEAGWENTTVESGPVAETVAKLKKLNGGDIYVVGGAKLAATLIDAGLVDEYRLVINPSIVGSGKSFFSQQKHRESLELARVKQLDSGSVVLWYRTKS